MVIHAFVDESGSSGRYQISMALVEADRLALIRRELRALLLPGQRELRCKQEKPARRRILADRIALLGCSVLAYRASSDDGEERARERCLRRAVEDLLALDGRRLVLDSRQGRDHHDVRVLRDALGPRPSRSGLTYQHMDSVHEPLLWIAGVLGWCYNAGGLWRQRVGTAVAGIELDLEVREARLPTVRTGTGLTSAAYGAEAPSL
jgi:hypothetical protein